MTLKSKENKFLLVLHKRYYGPTTVGLNSEVKDYGETGNWQIRILGGTAS